MVVHRARFLPQERLALAFPEGGGELHGYFPKDPTLKEFLQSPRPGRILVTMVHSFAAEHTVEDCRSLIDAFAEGGDGGVTRAVMRRACNLPSEAPAVERVAAQAPVPGNAALAGTEVVAPAMPAIPGGAAPAPPGSVLLAPGRDRPSVETPESRVWPVFLRSAQGSLLAKHVQLVLYCLSTSRDIVTSSVVERMPSDVWAGATTARKKKIDLRAGGRHSNEGPQRYNRDVPLGRVGALLKLGDRRP